MPTHKHCRLFYTLAGRPQNRSATVWDNLLGPIRWIGCWRTTYDDDCFYHYKWWFSTFDWGSMRSNLIFRFEIINSLRSHHLLLLSKEKIRWRNLEKRLVQDLIPPPSIYIHMPVCTLYTYTNTYMPRFIASGFFGPSRCLIPTPGLIRVPICAVCVCVRIHTPAPTYTSMRFKIEKTQTNTSIFLFCHKKST